jgi:DNA-directed RNA polymerase subunit M/transcription elongation factor TFIIS
MGIEFCPKCKKILTPRPEKDKLILTCKSCNITITKDSKEIILETEKIKQKQIGKGAAEPNFSGHHFKCKECGNDRCKVIDLGCMIGDEDWIYLLQCTKCDYAKRIGDWC